MNETEASADTSAGGLLRVAREASGIALADIAAKTRIPQRHLEAIERDDFAALPSTTYSVGFARAFARSVGADEVAVAAAVRAQLEQGGRERLEYQAYEPADPARVPPRMLAWTAAIVAVLILAGYGLWRVNWRDPAATTPAIATSEPNMTAPENKNIPAPPAAVATSGPVILTATDAVWLRINDAAGTRLFEKEMATGESYTVPADANGPTLTTGRPNMLRITVGGVEIAPLGEPEKRIKDIGISAEALRARPAIPRPALVPIASNMPTRVSETE